MGTKKTLILLTGGHHTSALPVIDLLQKKDNVSLLWVGHKHSVSGDKNTTLEYREISALNIPFVNLVTGKFYRTYNLIKLLKIPLGFIHAFYVLLRFRPKIILSFGGYLAVPVVIVGWLLGIPSYTHEQTVVTGYANKLIAKFVRKIFVSWEQSKQYFPKEKVIYSGLPLRNEIYNSSSNNFKINDSLPTVYIMAGKTGSHKINLLVESALEELLKYANVIHQTGDHSKFDDFSRINDQYAKISKDTQGIYNSRKFVMKDEIGEAYSKSNLFIGRSGAHTIAELAILEKPSLLIPISWVSHNEQLENASVIKKLGIGEILEENNLTKELFLEKIKEMLSNIDSYKVLPNARVEKTDSAKIIVDEILKNKTN